MQEIFRETEPEKKYQGLLGLTSLQLYGFVLPLLTFIGLPFITIFLIWNFPGIFLFPFFKHVVAPLLNIGGRTGRVVQVGHCNMYLIWTDGAKISHVI